MSAPTTSLRAALLAGLAIAAAPLAAQTYAITGAKLITGDGSAPIENGTIVIQNGKVVAAGSSVAVPAGAERIDAGGKYVTPGIFAGFSRVGLVEVDAVSGTNDTQANSSPFNASIDVAPAINPTDTAFSVSRAAGVTRAVVSPDAATSIFAGQGALVDLGEDFDAVTIPRAFQFAEMGERGAREAGGSRAAAHTLFRNALREARDFGNRANVRGGGAAQSEGQRLSDVSPDLRMLESNADRPQDVLLTRFDAAALVPVVQGQQRLLVHVESANDILRTLDLKKEFPNLRLVLVGASEGWRVANRIAASGVPVIASALNDLPASFEQLAATQSNIGRMRDAGVKVAIGMIDDNDAHQLRYASQYAGNLVGLQKVPGATGLTWDEAFAAISGDVADIMGVGDRYGHLRVGAAGDVVLWSGDPLELSSTPERVWIDGVEQSLDNRQARLRERYRTPQEGVLPKAYER
ncbi:amidohydrolase family protein [Novosphingopyxis baekryungensis]|uniref:amidohydrolase family protein n=1 Tax=Novosphingopyxis baekryungensis TaxID=279369 RepID=UPI0003B5A254|nr:amidohydrolase family protein [Novosphingopyxis baekryungensis]